MEIIDVHAHLTDDKFDDVEDVVARATESGVERIVCSAYNFSSSCQAVELSKRFAGVFANVGLHPENVEEMREGYLEKIFTLSKENKVVAIGEIGLDYHYRTDNKDLQKEVFIKQIEFANSVNLPVVIHSRDAIGDTIEILKQYPPKRESLLHCYAGSVESAKILMQLGFSFSFGGVVTFANAKNTVEVVKQLPLDRILIETDCPYLSPVPFRGKRNEPKNVVYIADMIAKIKGITLEEVAKVTTKNAERIFKL
ncbi:MAG: TatD family hydrolase [Clostridia bacterium]|nr:TatD family hydrolase [Clostridia bacterium]